VHLSESVVIRAPIEEVFDCWADLERAAEHQKPTIDRTRMDFETTIEPSGLMGLFAPLMKPWARRQLRDGLDSFRSWVESGNC
jgi:hypothetical protein